MQKLDIFTSNKENTHRIDILLHAIQTYSGYFHNPTLPVVYQYFEIAYRVFTYLNNHFWILTFKYEEKKDEEKNAKTYHER